MEIYIGNMASDMTAYDLRIMFNQAIDEYPRSFFFFRNQSIPTDLDFRVVEKYSDDQMYRFGYALVEPDALARHCIGVLNHSFSHGQSLLVREYYQRACMNERRSLNWRNKAWNGSERRATDRRVRLMSAAAA